MNDLPNVKVVLVTSTPVDNTRHAWARRFKARGGLDEYLDKNFCNTMRALSEKHGLPLCDLHEVFTREFKKDPHLVSKVIRPDGVHLTGVHLTEEGNEMAAQALAPVIYAQLTGKTMR